MDQLKRNVDVVSCHPHVGDKIVFVQEGEDSRQIKKYRLEPVQSQGELYRKYLNVERVQRLAKAQGILSILVFMTSLVTSCSGTRFTSLEYIGCGIWVPILTVIGAVTLFKACKDVTYVKLHLALLFQSLSSAGWLILAYCAFSDGIPTKSRDIRFYYYERDLYESSTTVGFIKTALVFTAITSVAGLVQLALSSYMAYTSVRAMCQGRTQLERKLYGLELIGGEDVHVDRGESIGEKKVESQDELPPPYEEKSKI